MTRTRAIIAGSALVALGLASLNGVALGATGHGLILGHVNHADKTTTIKRSGAGPALALYSRKSQAPLYVNSSKVVKRLNADSVDGHSAASLQTNDIRFQIPTTSGSTTATFALDGLPKGIYEASFNVLATMPTAGDRLNCSFLQNGAAEVLAYGGSFISFSTVSGAGVLDLRAGLPLTFRCFTSGTTFSLSGTNDERAVNLIKIDGYSTRDQLTPMVAPASKSAVRGATGR